jgi:hypothetical protein
MPDNEAVQDFVNEMYVAVMEELGLHEVAQGSTDLLPTGPVTHGPWPVEHVAVVLRTWHDAGWIDLYYPELPASWEVAPADWQQRLRPDRVLDAADAADLLAQPDRWTIKTADGQASLCQTALGQATEVDQWLDLASRTTQ